MNNIQSVNIPLSPDFWPRPITKTQWLSLVGWSLLLLIMGGVNTAWWQMPAVSAQPPTLIELPELPPIPIAKDRVTLLGDGAESRWSDLPAEDVDSQVSTLSHMGGDGEVEMHVVNPLGQVNATAYYVWDVASQTVLTEKNSQEKLPPASTMKLLTAMVALDLYEADQLLTIASQDMWENQLGLQVGESYSRDDLLAALLVSSSNEAAYTLARQHPEGISGFVQVMNEKAKSIGLTNTQVQNPAGFDHPDQFSTAIDLSRLAQVALSYPEIAQLVSSPVVEIASQSNQRLISLRNTNALLTNDPTALGIKTGTTPLAKEVLISQFDRNGHQIEVVVLGSHQRYVDTQLLLDWVLNKYVWVEI